MVTHAKVIILIPAPRSAILPFFLSHINLRAARSTNDHNAFPSLKFLLLCFPLVSTIKRTNEKREKEEKTRSHPADSRLLLPASRENRNGVPSIRDCSPVCPATDKWQNAWLTNAQCRPIMLRGSANLHR